MAGFLGHPNPNIPLKMKPTPLLLASLAMLALPLHAATTISVNFYNSTVPGLALNPSDSAGVEAVGNWNNIGNNAQTGSSTTNSLNDSTGMATAAGITYFNGFWYQNDSTATPNQKLNSGYTNTGTAAAGGTISLSGLDSAFTTLGYDVIVYLGGTDSMGQDTPAEFGVNIDGGATQWIRYVRNNPVVATFSSIPFATEEAAQASATQSNYIRFSGLTGTSFDLNILPDPDSTANWARAAVRGVQIIAVPEPSAALLLGGALGFVFLRRRRS